MAPEPVLVVTDAGPLMALGRHDLLGLLPRLFRQVHVPQVVLRECLARPELPDAHAIQAAVDVGWLQTIDTVTLEILGLDRGECAAIAGAIEMQATLLVDDRAARRQAQTMGLPVLGTLGVLILAKRKGLLAEIKPVLKRMREQGHYISETAMQAALHVAGEKQG